MTEKRTYTWKISPERKAALVAERVALFQRGKALKRAERTQPQPEVNRASEIKEP
jgi:hypothetical protein